MTELLRERFVDRQDKTRKEFNGDPNDPIRVSFYDLDKVRVNDVTRKEANKVAAAGGGPFYFQDKNRIQQELTIQQVNELVPARDLGTSSSCDIGPKPCGPPILNIFGGEGLGALVNTIVSPVSSGVIAFDIINGGKNYTVPPFAQLIDKCGNGSGSRLETEISNGQLTRIKVKAPGDGFLSAPDGSFGGGGRTTVPAPDPNDPSPRLPTATLTASKFLLNSPEEITLFWTTQNVTRITITDLENNLPLIGNQKVLVERTKTYVLTASGPGGTVTSQVTITLLPAPPPDPPTPTPNLPPFVVFTSSKFEVNPDEEFELQWQVTNANNIRINQGIGNVTREGKTNLTISNTTTYTLTATGVGGTISRTVTVVYKTPIVPPTVTPTPQLPTVTPTPVTPPILGPTYPVVIEIEDVDIIDSGFGYQPGDEIIVTPDKGAVLEPVIDNGRIVRVIVIKPGLGFDDFPEIKTNSQTGNNFSAIPIFKVRRLEEEPNFIPPPDATIISVVDCVGKIPPKTEVDRVPR